MPEHSTLKSKIAGGSAGGLRYQRAGRAGMGWLKVLAGDSKGVLLLETVIAAMVFALVGVAVLAGLSTAYTSGSKTQVQAASENLARNQLEYIFGQPYREPEQTPYPTITGVPADYSVSASVDYEDQVDQDPEVERVTVTVQHDAQEILSLETLRGRDDGLQLRYSYNNDRSGSVRLEGETISGVVYVFLDDPELRVDNQSEFYLDGAGPITTEVAVPWDFKGGDVATANPWDTTTDPPATNGPHTMKATILLNDGNTVNVTADFTISN